MACQRAAVDRVRCRWRAGGTAGQARRGRREPGRAPLNQRRGCALACVLLLLQAPAAGAQLPSTAGQNWFVGNVWIQLPHHLRILAAGELNAGTNYSYQQWTAGAGLAYQWKRVSELTHLVNINSDKESRLVFASGYEYLWTEQEGSTSVEDRLLLVATPRYRPFGRWLIEDRNRVEFRWVDGDYETRYRNRLAVERDLLVGSFRFTPYVSAEFFYSFGNNSWDEQQYAVGIQWPFRRVFMVETYYLYQHTTKAPTGTNVFGLSMNFYLRNGL